MLLFARIVVLLLVFTAATQAEDTQREALKASMLSARDDTTMTIFFKSGLSTQIRFDKKLGTLGQLSSDFAAYTGGASRRLYTYQAVRESDGSLAVDLDSVEGIYQVLH